MKLEIKPTPQTVARIQKLQVLGKGILSDTDITGSVKTITELVLESIKYATPGSESFKEGWMMSFNKRAEGIQFLIKHRAEPKLKKDSRGDTLLNYLEFGTKPHRIEAKNAQALRFMIVNSVIFAKYVRHPGTKAYGMIAAGEKVFKQHLDSLVSNIRRQINKKIQEV